MEKNLISITRLIEAYYNYFNQQDSESFIGLLDENIIHDINQGETQVGKKVFQKFMQRMNQCYQETIENIIIMTNPKHPHCAATEFTVIGTYLYTDPGLPEAKGQQYTLRGGAFFEASNNKLIRITNYYNMNEWLTQIKG